MRRTEMLQEIRKMRFEEVYLGWSESRLTQEEAAQILGVCDRTFRRQIDRYEHGGMEGFSDKRLTQASFHRAPVDEVMSVAERYSNRYRGWNVKHFYKQYIEIELRPFLSERSCAHEQGAIGLPNRKTEPEIARAVSDNHSCSFFSPLRIEFSRPTRTTGPRSGILDANSIV
jgi:hypothetical protein